MGTLVFLLLLGSSFCLLPAVLIDAGTRFVPELANPGRVQTWQAKLWICLSLLICFALICLLGYAYIRFLLRVNADHFEYWNRPLTYFDVVREAREQIGEAQGLGRSPFGKYGAEQLARQRDNRRKAMQCAWVSIAFLLIGVIVGMLPMGIPPDMQRTVKSSIMGLGIIPFLYALWLSYRR